MHRLALAAALAVLSFSAQAGYAVPPECKALAQQRGYPMIMSESQAGRAVKVLNKYAGWPGVNACRSAVKRDWKL